MAADCEQDVVAEKRILYDLDIPQEWPETAATLTDSDLRSLWKMMTSVVQACRWFTITAFKNPTRLIGFSSQPPSILSDLMSSRLSWQLILSSDGRQLAVLQDSQIEIRSILDDFTTARATIKVAVDPYPQWRKGVWSPQGTSLAYANSLGHVTIYHYNGEALHRLIGTGPSSISERTEASGMPLLMTAVAGMTFINTSDSLLFVVATYEGHITTHRLKEIRDNHVLLHRVSLLDYYPYGVGTIQYLPQSDVMIVAGWSEEQDTPLIGCWRFISEQPYWIPAPGNEIKKSRKGTFRSLIDKRTFNDSWVFTMALSPDQSTLATLSLSGSVSIWDVPSCRLKTTWLPHQLPGSHDSHMTATSFGFETSLSRANSLLPIEITWWSNDSLILVNSLFKVTVVSIKTLVNLLGHSPEPGASVTPGYGGQLLMLEGEVYTRLSKRQQLLPSLSDESDDGVEDKLDETVDDDREEETKDSSYSFQKKLSSFSNQIMYFLTEREQFRPHREKLRVQCTQYRLVCLKSMEPEECYQRKIENEEYGEALELARQYNLDCDLVYQCQWQLSVPVSAAAIQDYLSRVTNRSWVLKECLHCIAPDFLTMKELLTYGLHRTSFKELLALRDEERWRGIEDEDTLIPLEIIANWKSLSEEEIFLCRCRETLLTYIDRLNTYEVILGGPAATFERYDAQVFGDFRNTNLVQSALDYAQDGNIEAVEALFDRHGDAVLPYRLVILSSFPETTSPESYHYLLPSLNEEDELEEWEEESVRERDWVEDPVVKQLYSLGKQLSVDVVNSEETVELKDYLDGPFTSQLLSTWYCNRAVEIEKFSGQVDNALCLIQLGIKNNIKGLEVLEHQLLTLKSLIYHCNADIHLNLSKLEKMSHMEILHLMMHEVEEGQFVFYFTTHAIPYIDRLMKLKLTSDTNLLQDFMINISKTDLRPCSNLLKNIKRSTSPSVSAMSLETKMSLALKCIYTCERTDQLDQIDIIAGYLTSLIGTKQLSGHQKELYEQLNDLENLTCATEILADYNVFKSIKYINDIKGNRTETEQLLRRVVRVASRKTPPLSEKGWKTLQKNLMTLKTKVFHCIDSNTCMKIFTESLICSGSIDNISLATEALTLTPDADDSSGTSGFSHVLPYDISVDVIVKAAQEYFNSAAGPRDQEIELARLCLQLIKEDSSSLVSERNLISSLEILSEFDISLLPIHVRLCENKLDLIKQALDSSSTAYKKYDKLFKLSYLLGLSSESDTSLHSMSTWTKMSTGRGYTTIYIAMAALLYADYKSAHRLCVLLMNCSFPNAWEVTKELGTAAGFTDLKAKMDLLNFAVTHCPVEEIQIILKERRVLEAQLLCNDCKRKHQFETGSVRQLVGQSVQQFVTKGADTVQQLIGGGGQRSMDSTSDHVIGNKSHQEILLKCVKELNELRAVERGPAITPLRLIYHPFYPVPSSTAPITYTKCQEINSQLHISVSQALLRVRQILKVTDHEIKGIVPLTDLLVTSAQYYTAHDIHLFLGYLFDLVQSIEEVESLLSLIPPSAFVYHVTMYYCCLLLYLNSDSTPCSFSHPYNHRPTDLISHVLCHVTNSSPSDWPESCHPFIKLLKTSKSLLFDYTQAKKLQGCDIEFDLTSFIRDKTYKEQIIMSLAKQGDSTVFGIALILCEHHSLDEWELYMGHLNWLLTESGLLVDEINRRITEQNIMKRLLQQPLKTAQYLTDITYYSLPPTRYTVLLCYYTVLDQCVEEGTDLKDNISTHLKLLKKFKTTIREVNYRELMSGVDPISVLLPALGDHNIHPVAKLARSIPLAGKGYLTAKMIYRAYVTKVFWKEDSESSYSTSMWLSKFESCRDYIQRLDAEQVQYLVNDMLFSSNSLKLMSLKTREALLSQLVDISNEKKTMEGNKTEYSFSELLAELKIFGKHLQAVQQLSDDIPPQVESSMWSSVVRKYDLSISKAIEIHELCKEMCINGLSLNSMELILLNSAAVRLHTLTVGDIVLECLELLVFQNSFDQVDGILRAISNHELKGGKLLHWSRVLSALNPYYKLDSSKPLLLKYSLLKCMDKYVALSEEDSQLLVFYQTQDTLSNLFDCQVSLEDVSSLEKRTKLILSLSGQSSSLKQHEALAMLLEQWPGSCNDYTDCWLNILNAIAGYPSSCQRVVFIRAGLPDMNSKVDEEILSLLWTKNKQSALLYSLLSDNLTFITDKQIAPEDYEEFVSNTSLELILYNRLVPSVLGTPVYSYLCSYLSNPLVSSRQQLETVVDVPLLVRLIQCHEEELFEVLCYGSPAGRVERAVQQLQEAELHEEAERLLAAQRSGRGSLMGVTSALRSLKGFFGQ